MTKATYRNCEISEIAPPIPGEWFEWSHINYDGPSDFGIKDYGTANSVEACKKEIDDMHDEIEAEKDAQDYEEEMRKGKFDIRSEEYVA